MYKDKYNMRLLTEMLKGHWILFLCNYWLEAFLMATREFKYLSYILQKPLLDESCFISVCL